MTNTPDDSAEKYQFITGIALPDSLLVRDATQFVRDTESQLLFNHSSRVFCFASLAGQRLKKTFDPELLYVGAMFHDLGLTRDFSTANERFEVDGANAARDFLKQRNIAQQDVDDVWTAIALHTTPGIPQHMHPVVALVTAGVELDVLGIGLADVHPESLDEILQRFPRTEQFKEDIISAFFDGIKHKPVTTFGNIKADVLADKDPAFKRINFCDIIRASSWDG
ncbi:HD domain-containing protein [Caballeronia sp. M23-90]